MKTVCLIIGLLFVIKFSQAQQPALEQTLENIIESMNQDQGENIDFQQILDDLSYLSQHPISINSASREELQQLFFLSEFQIDDLIEFKNKTGQIYSLYEMAVIEGFNPDLLHKLEPFLSFEIQENNRQNKRPENDIIGRSTRAFSNSEDGVKDPNFKGSMERYYVRFKHSSGNLGYGIVSEKDPGETFFAGSNKHGFDYLGAYANFTIGSSGQKLFLGDYRVNFGQGLVANQGFSMGKSAETTQIFHSGPGVRSSSSTDENQFFRGIASQLKLGPLNFIPFVSFRTLDANIDTIDGKSSFGAFQTSGYHRTGSEIGGKNALEQIVGGGNLGISHGRWSIGVSGIFTRFNVPMDRSEDPGNRFLWEGRENLVAGIDWKGSVKNVFIFGEAAVSAQNGKALLTGLLFKPAPNAEITALYRNINKTYLSFFSNSFTESSRVNDENALYMALTFFPAPRWTLRSYADFFQYRWIKYTTAAPSNGTELFAQLTYRASDRTEFYLRFFQEDKKVKVISGNEKYNESQQINRYRFSFSQKLNENFSLKSRIECIFYSKLDEEKGYLAYQDLIYKPVGRRFSCNGRLAWFQTDGYNSRLYGYENDLLYSFSFPALFGKGIRTYLNIKQTFSKELSMWLKVAATHKVSTSENEQPGDSDTTSELKIQLRYQF